MKKAEEIICEICKQPCTTGAIFLKSKHTVCVSCVYKKLGSDNYNGHDWSFSIMHKTAQELIDAI